MSTTKEKFREVGLNLYNKLRLLIFPVAIKFIKDYKEIPEKSQRPSKMALLTCENLRDFSLEVCLRVLDHLLGIF